MEKIQLGAVSYLNTKPLLYGIERLPIHEHINILVDHPANIAEMLMENEIDLGLVPVAIIPQLKNSFVVSDYCIAADGAVASVCIFSEVPMQEIQTVILDYQSKTSVNLARILLNNYWQKDVQFEQATENYEQRIHGTTAALIIGDRALYQRKISPYIYDLAEAWKAYTDLPFVFAAWVANKPLSAEFISKFNEANAYGLSRLDEVIEQNPFAHYDLRSYYTKNICYRFTNHMHKGMQRFLDELELLKVAVD
jgi:chorismate dehydratase